jgi:hypothetical protein
MFVLCYTVAWNISDMKDEKDLIQYKNGSKGKNPGQKKIPVGARFSAPVQTGPGAYPTSCTMGTGSFPGVKRPGRGVDHPPPSSAEVKKRVELYIYSPSGPSWPVLGRALPLPLYFGIAHSVMLATCFDLS